MTSLPRPEPMPAFSYTDATVSPLYHCGECGAHGVKLWREYEAFLNRQSLLCAGCSCKEQNLIQRDRNRTYTVEQDASGEVYVTRFLSKDHEPMLYDLHEGGIDRGGDQIGWRVPAVPTEDGTTFWSYCAVPAAGVAWWRNLPLEMQDRR